MSQSAWLMGLSLYHGCKTVKRKLSHSFSMKIGAYQESVLNSVICHCSRCFDRCGGWFIDELLHTDYLALCGNLKMKLHEITRLRRRY